MLSDAVMAAKFGATAMVDATSSFQTQFQFQSQFQSFTNSVNESFNLAEAAINQRLQNQLQTFNQQQTDALQAPNAALSAALNVKDNISAAITQLQKSDVPIIQIQNELEAARAAAASGDAASFDNALFAINLQAGDSTVDPTNLIGAQSPSDAGARTTVFPIAGLNSTSVDTQSLAVSYVLQLSTGETVVPDFRDSSVTINDTKYSLLNAQYVSGSGNTVTFTLQPVDGTSPSQTVTATVQRGGLGLANSFFYGGLSTSAQQTQAIADIDHAISTVDEVSANVSTGETLLEGALDRQTTTTTILGRQVGDLITKQQSDAAAYEQAAQTKAQIALGLISVTAKNQMAQIQALFQPPQPVADTVLNTLNAVPTLNL